MVLFLFAERKWRTACQSRRAREPADLAGRDGARGDRHRTLIFFHLIYMFSSLFAERQWRTAYQSRRAREPADLAGGGGARGDRHRRLRPGDQLPVHTTGKQNQ
jgi:hypothetical protein